MAAANLVAKLQNAKALLKSGVSSLGPDREFDTLIRAIGESKSKQEEDRIMASEIETLKQRLSDPKLDKARAREYMVRAIYCEMLGHDVSWAHVKALQFASEPSIHTKKAAYLAMTQFLDHNSELVLLLVNTLLSDLKSDNFVAVCSALGVTTKLIGPDLINALLPTVLERLHHPKEHVRKKAVLALLRFQQLDPRRDGPLSGVDVDRHLRTMLCDKDPSVMSAALSALYCTIRQDTAPYKNLIPSFTSILKQVSEHRLPKTYDYHRFPAPFIQIKLLKVLAALGAGDRIASENMYTVIQQALRRANSSHTIGNALIYECVRTITTIYPNPGLLAAAAEAVAAFLRSTSHNLRYVGIDALAGIVKINPQYAQEHQLAVIDCLEDPDDTLKLKTLELLYKMTKANNVEVICERMMAYLRTTTDEHIKRDIVRKVSELAERYAPSPAWFIKVVSEVFELGGEHTEPSLAHSLLRLVAEQDTELHRGAVEVYLRLLDKPKLPELLLQVAVWVLGEYGTLAASSTRPLSTQGVMNRLVSLVSTHKASDSLKAYVLSALAKLACQGGVALTPEAQHLVSSSSSSSCIELQRRAYQLQAMLASPPALQASALPPDASCEDIDDAAMESVRSLDWLEGYVQGALRAGAAPYIPEDQRAGVLGRAGGAGAGVEKGTGSLRFAAYETTAAPSSTSGASARGASFVQPARGGAGADGGCGGGSGGGAAAARGSHSRNASGGTGADVGSSGAPELQLRGASAAGRKWGPAQFESSGGNTSSTSAASGRAGAGTVAPAATSGRGSAAGADLLGALADSSSASSRSQHQQPSERDRLAASIFGGASGVGAGGAGAGLGTTPVARSSPASQPQQQLDLLDITSSPIRDPQPSSHSTASTTLPPAAAPKSQFDLLMDLDVPTPAPASVPATTAGPSSLNLGNLGMGAVPGLGAAATGAQPRASGVSALGGPLDLLGGPSLGGAGPGVGLGGDFGLSGLGLGPSATNSLLGGGAGGNLLAGLGTGGPQLVSLPGNAGLLLQPQTAGAGAGANSLAGLGGLSGASLGGVGTGVGSLGGVGGMGAAGGASHAGNLLGGLGGMNWAQPGMGAGSGAGMGMSQQPMWAAGAAGGAGSRPAGAMGGNAGAMGGMGMGMAQQAKQQQKSAADTELFKDLF